MTEVPEIPLLDEQPSAGNIPPPERLRTWGRLGEVATWVAQVQGTWPPTPFRSCRLVVFAGDHGVSQLAISTGPAGGTVELVAALLAGTSPAAVLARFVDVPTRLVDISVDGDGMRVCPPSGRIDEVDALTPAHTEDAFAAGRAVADQEADSGTDLLVAGDLGVGSTAPAAVIIAALTRQEPAVVVGRGSGIDDAGWMRKTTVVRDALFRSRTLNAEPMDLLRAVGGADLAALTGFLVQAAVRRTPVVLDGVVSTACALLAERIAPGAGQWWIAGHRSTEPGHTIALTALGLTPVVDYGLSIGGGAGAVLAVTQIQAAIAALAEAS